MAARHVTPRLTWPLIFRRLRNGVSKDPPQATDVPSPPPPIAPDESVGTPIKLSHDQEEELSDSLRAKVSRVLKDLSLDAPGTNIAAVVGGGKNRPKKPSPPSSHDTPPKSSA
jgi:hypothetical protein